MESPMIRANRTSRKLKSSRISFVHLRVLGGGCLSSRAPKAPPHANFASKLIIWCLPAANAFSAGASRTRSFPRASLCSSAAVRTPGSGRRMNDSTVRQDSPLHLRPAVHSAHSFRGSPLHPRPTNSGSATASSSTRPCSPTAPSSTAPHPHKPPNHHPQPPPQPPPPNPPQAPPPQAPPPQAQTPQADQQSSSSQETQEEVGPVRKKKQAHPYNKWTFNVGGGASLTNGNTQNFVRGGGGVAAVGATRNANRYLGLRLDFQFDNLPLRTSALQAAQASSANSHAYTLMLDPIINIPISSNWGGYVLGGPTFLRRSGKLDNSSAIPGSACNSFFLWWGHCFNNSLPINGNFLHASQNEFG